MALITFAEDDVGDMLVIDGRNLILIEGEAALAQSVGSATRMVINENPFNTSEGIDYFGVVFAPTPDFDSYREQLETAALSVNGVIDVTSVELSKEGDQLQYKMEIATEYGEQQALQSIKSPTGLF